MASSSDQISKNIADGMLAYNPSVDVTKGPFFDLAIRPQANEIANASANAERVSTLFSRMVNNSDSLTTAEINALGTAFKVAQPVGSPARVTMIFWTSSKPTKEIVIPAGTAVASADGLYVFTTSRTVRGIDTQTAAMFYDANSGRYLIPVPAVAISASAAYNMPAFRITLMLGRVNGISGVYNPSPSTGGVDPHQASDYLSNIQATFSARDTSLIAGLKVDLIRRGATSTFEIVDSTQRETFTRPVVGAAVDVYLNDAQEDAYDEVIVGGGRSRIVLSMQPVLTVSSVSVNGRQLDSSAWSVDFDNSLNYGRSASASTAVILPATALSDQVRVTYTYASSVQGLAQTFVDQDIMGCDVLVRLTRPVYIAVKAYVACNAEMLAQVTASLASYLTLPFNTRLDPAEAYNYVRTAFPEVTKLTWATFALSGSTDVSEIDVPVGYVPAFASASDFQVSLARS